MSSNSKTKPVEATETQVVHPTPEMAQAGADVATDYPRPTSASQLNSLTDEEKERKKQGYMDAQEKDKKKPAADANHKKQIDPAKTTNAAAGKKDQASRISQPPGRGLEF